MSTETSREGPPVDRSIRQTQAVQANIPAAVGVEPQHLAPAAFPGFGDHNAAEAAPSVAPPTVPTNAVVAAEVPSARPALKLQAIVYNPTRPSAIINGKTLFVGDTVGDMRLAAVTRGSATLSGRGSTTVLELEH